MSPLNLPFSRPIIKSQSLLSFCLSTCFQTDLVLQPPLRMSALSQFFRLSRHGNFTSFPDRLLQVWLPLQCRNCFSFCLQVISISVTGACLLEKLLNICHKTGHIAEVPRSTLTTHKTYVYICWGTTIWMRCTTQAGTQDSGKDSQMSSVPYDCLQPNSIERNWPPQAAQRPGVL